MIEPLADCAWIAGLVPHDRRTARDEPCERIVESLPHEPLQIIVAAGTLLAERRELAVTEDDTRRQQHRAACARAFLTHDHGPPELTEPGGGNEPGHAGARNRDLAHVKLKVGLCSTYSMRTRSGPHRNAA